LATVQRQVSAASSLASSKLTQLTTRYSSSTKLITKDLPAPIKVAHDATWWQTRQLAMNSTIQIAQAQVEIASAAVNRAKADRLPDPTFGVFTASEAYGNERIIGLSASIPLGSKRRVLEVERLQTQLDSARLNLVLIEREQRAESINRYNAAISAFEQWQLAQQTASLMAENAKLTQKAYTLGEGDIQQLLLAQRQALSAAEDELSAQVTALRAYADLLLNAQLLWPDLLNSKTL
ncbi:MAG: TolC family protein, partial [Gammaproteobacteria bacterium]|nr:TolC family protein [Gammaproteobacteria bacterium]